MKTSDTNTTENTMNTTCPTHGNTLVLSMSQGGVCLFCNHTSQLGAFSPLEAPQLTPKTGE